ncbi:MAG: rRNA maturation RNase YbeY [Candidatus Omnitrophica bacterium]|nr:rRNA maturation RNase YbeY [Candidatus Omnitrophota bacterium]
MRITLKNLQRKIRISPARIRKIAYNIAPPASLNNLKLSLYFVENDVIKKLNRKFFGRNRLTDVISFRLSSDCAEVFVAPCVAKSNALAFKTGFPEELYRCVIHGILHVFGYKDGAKKEKERMWRAQEKILKKMAKDTVCLNPKSKTLNPK